jgi:uncharacterized protein (DUF58 family)
MFSTAKVKNEQTDVRDGDEARAGIEASVRELAALRASARSIDLGAPKRGTSLLAGSYQSPIRGRGLEFAEVRNYAPGDEVRHIDWRVTARTGKPHSKLFEEERERPLLVLSDARTPMRFGTRACFKSVAAARAAALFVWAAAERGDRVGGVTLGDSAFRSFRLRRDRYGTSALIGGLADATSAPCGEVKATLADALMELRRIACAGAQVCVLSDFSGLDDVAQRHLQQLARYTDTSCVLIHDPLEATPPAPGQYRVSNGDNVIAIGTKSRACRDSWTAPFDARRRELERISRKCRAGMSLLSTGDDETKRGANRAAALPGGRAHTVRSRGGR